jgi:carboxymethylenebutenolidase
MADRVSIPGVAELHGVLALPAGTARCAAIVVLQEYWGINAEIQDVVQRWADAGFVALAPDLYRGQVAKTPVEAARLMKALDFDKAVQDIAAAVELVRGHPRSTGKVALTGYCLGGALALAAAVHVRGLSAVVPFYGLPGARDWHKVDAPIQAHFARHDDWATVAGAEAIQAAVRVPMELHVYDAKHAFCNDQRPDVFDASASAQAWMRAVAFIRSHTGVSV